MARSFLERLCALRPFSSLVTLPAPSPSDRFRFPLGRVYATRRALAAARRAGVPVSELLRRHGSGDWGEVSAAQHEDNEWMAAEGAGAPLSIYTLPDGGCLWIWTALDGGAANTAVVLPDD
jgi:hypothetical protein